MKILVLNCGSSSLKYQLFNLPAGEVLAKGLVQRIGEPVGQLEQTAAGDRVTREEPVADHGAALRAVMAMLTSGPCADITEIGAVGHRVVHGGERFTDPALIDDEVVAAIEEHVELAPLHNPPNLLGIRVARQLLPRVPQVAVFDTAFHQSMPAHAYTYALPLALYREAKVRRYGFHGTSHAYVAGRAAALLGKPLDACNLITCHLGNGSSICAVQRGRSVDTSMGLTPLEGLVMGTRSGDIDPAIIFHLARVRGLDLDQLDKLLNKQSGLLGLSESSNDVRELVKRRATGDPKATLALDVFCYRIRKYIGAYAAALGKVDALVFTAGIGENATELRAQICTGLEILGLRLDADHNAAARGVEATVSTPDSASTILVVPTNEEKAIAQQTYSLASEVQA